MGRARRIGKSAERLFSTMCSDAGLLCHSATEDEMGWDFLVEFPPHDYCGPAENAPAGSRAYVQIKSTSQKSPQTRIKLSNARHSSNHSDPWFLIFYHYIDDQNHIIYAKHFWKDLIYNSLKLSRKADLDGHKLNKKYLIVKFDHDDEHTDDLFSWMEMEISQYGSSYNQEKIKLTRTLGYEESYGSGKITFSAQNEDVFIRQLLGMGDGIDIKEFEYTPSRFGLSQESPPIKFQGGIANIIPVEFRACKLVLRGKNSFSTINLDGKLYSTGLGKYDNKFQVFRVSTSFFETIWRMNGESTFDLLFDLDQIMPISEIEDISKIMTWFHLGEVDVQLWIDEKRVLGSEMTVHNPGSIKNWSFLNEVSHFFRTFFNTKTHISPRTILSNLERLFEIKNLIEINNFSIDFHLNQGFLSENKNIINVENFVYSIVEPFGNEICFSVIYRKVNDFNINEENAIFTIGEADILTSYSLPCDQENLEDQLQSDFHRLLKKYPPNTLSLFNLRG